MNFWKIYYGNFILKKVTVTCGKKVYNGRYLISNHNGLAENASHNLRKEMLIPAVCFIICSEIDFIVFKWERFHVSEVQWFKMQSSECPFWGHRQNPIISKGLKLEKPCTNYREFEGKLGVSSSKTASRTLNLTISETSSSPIFLLCCREHQVQN